MCVKIFAVIGLIVPKVIALTRAIAQKVHCFHSNDQGFTCIKITQALVHNFHENVKGTKWHPSDKSL